MGFVVTLTHNRSQLPFFTKMVVITMLLWAKNEPQRSVNDLWPCILENPRVVQRDLPIIKPSADILGKNHCDNIAAMS
jgi:hypothetical protein